MKAYVMCDASNGYCCKFSLYTGKTYNQDPSECGKIYDLVMELMKDYNGKGHHSRRSSAIARTQELAEWRRCKKRHGKET